MSLLVALALILHPQPWVAVLVLPLAFLTWQRWKADFGAQAPRRIEFQEGRWWITDGQGELHLLPSVMLWRSFTWLVFYLPWRPLGLRSWMLWPDALSCEQRRQLRSYLRKS
ncbi:hypothetical protein [Marinospirillum sp.]|uniref:hypothetical protein n=1 Tax=Marinospirillum sp. TaxID=2183934 RepID=UPI00286FE21F|nr:hypothetical protein [Marinospirillum sp.]